MLDFFSPARMVVSCIISALCISGGKSISDAVTTQYYHQARVYSAPSAPATNLPYNPNPQQAAAQQPYGEMCGVVVCTC